MIAVEPENFDKRGRQKISLGALNGQEALEDA
jgi:hypothetical protein